MGSKYTNTKKKMASLGLKKDHQSGYVYIDSEDTQSEFVPVREHKKKNK